jgi:hypothetical protein
MVLPPPRGQMAPATGRIMRDKPAFLEGPIQDLRFGARQILRWPGFALLVMLTLAVGIGANVAIFSVLKGIVLRQLPYQEPERLVAVWETPPRGAGTSPSARPTTSTCASRPRASRRSECWRAAGSTSPASPSLSGSSEPVARRAS